MDSVLAVAYNCDNRASWTARWHRHPLSMPGTDRDHPIETPVRRTLLKIGKTTASNACVDHPLRTVITVATAPSRPATDPMPANQSSTLRRRASVVSTFRGPSIFVTAVAHPFDQALPSLVKARYAPFPQLTSGNGVVVLPGWVCPDGGANSTALSCAGTPAYGEYGCTTFATRAPLCCSHRVWTLARSWRRWATARSR